MDDERKRLKWMCRRGTKELDVLMTTYLQDSYDTATDAEKAGFFALLQLEDTELYDLFLGLKGEDCGVRQLLQNSSNQEV